MSAKNYHKILSNLFRKYNPAKLKEVDALLVQFAGREEELIEKIHLKYAGKATSKSKKSKKPALLLVILLLLGGLGFGGWYAANQGLIPGWDKSETTENPDNIYPESDANLEKNDSRQQTVEEVEMDSESMETAYSAPPIEYGVQIGLFSDADNEKVKTRLGDRQLDLNVLPADNDLFMYVVGNDLELDAARTRRDELRENGFPDAFVVGLRKGKRVEIRPGE
jgi:hypothetical protein